MGLPFMNDGQADYAGFMKTFARTLLFLVLFGSVQVEGEQEKTNSEADSLGVSDPVGVKQTVRALAGPGSKVVLDEANDRLLLVTTKERHAQIAVATQKLNVPPRNVRIQVQFRGASKGESMGGAVGGDVQVIRNEGIAHTTIRLGPLVKNSLSRTSQNVVETLFVGSGRSGMIQVGESVLYLKLFTEYGLRWGYLQQRINWQQVGKSLMVEPMIRVKLTPELSRLVGGNPLYVRFTMVVTEVEVQDGHTFQCDGLDMIR